MSYADKLSEELRIYREVKNVHELPPMFHYWSSKYVGPKFTSLGFENATNFYFQYIRSISMRSPAPCKVLSLGAGNCDTEVELACLLTADGRRNFTIDCLDLNPQMLSRGKQLASERGVEDHFRFLESDINSWSPEAGGYDIAIANHSLHHFVELEMMFQKTHECLSDEGYFLANDMIGRNGHMLWPEALELVQAFWSLLDDKHKWNCQLQRFEPTFQNWNCSVEGFEGIRAQDILPLLVKTFHFECFVGFANIITVFVDRSFGHNFDVNDPRDCYFIDVVAQIDEYFIESGKLKPTQMVAAMTKSRRGEPRYYKGFSPQASIRDPAL